MVRLLLARREALRGDRDMYDRDGTTRESARACVEIKILRRVRAESPCTRHTG